MSDLPEEESIKNSHPNGPDNQADENNLLINPDPNHPIQQSKEMEVHHHAHHEGKRGWKSYFWEFLMLFLAVFCGFLAEYQLEHVIEHQREKKLMRTLSADLTNDKITLQTYITWRNQTNSNFDSLLLLLSNPDPEENAYQVYRLMNRTALRFGLPDVNAGAISQLTYSGGLRLVRSSAVTDAINKHYLGLNRMKSAFETERPIRLKLLESKSAILDARLLMPSKLEPDAYSFLSTDQASINELMHDILSSKQINNGLISQLDSFRVSTDKLNELIKKEYHIN
ncbi:MAG: hypothetical protein IPP25_18210 [Saprospiraceae bacterium]|nr:hypothetical protein [Candidatus Opimibacter skivensis]